jgi:hypothetical protein
VKDMMQSDLKLMQKDQYLKDGGVLLELFRVEFSPIFVIESGIRPVILLN